MPILTIETFDDIMGACQISKEELKTVTEVQLHKEALPNEHNPCFLNHTLNQSGHNYSQCWDAIKEMINRLPPDIILECIDFDFEDKQSNCNEILDCFTDSPIFKVKDAQFLSNLQSMEELPYINFKITFPAELDEATVHTIASNIGNTDIICPPSTLNLSALKSFLDALVFLDRRIYAPLNETKQESIDFVLSYDFELYLLSSIHNEEQIKRSVCSLPRYRRLLIGSIRTMNHRALETAFRYLPAHRVLSILNLDECKEEEFDMLTNAFQHLTSAFVPMPSQLDRFVFGTSTITRIIECYDQLPERNIICFDYEPSIQYELNRLKNAHLVMICLTYYDQLLGLLGSCPPLILKSNLTYRITEPGTQEQTNKLKEILDCNPQTKIQISKNQTWLANYPIKNTLIHSPDDSVPNQKTMHTGIFRKWGLTMLIGDKAYSYRSLLKTWELRDVPGASCFLAGLVHYGVVNSNNTRLDHAQKPSSGQSQVNLKIINRPQKNAEYVKNVTSYSKRFFSVWRPIIRKTSVSYRRVWRFSHG